MLTIDKVQLWNGERPRLETVMQTPENPSPSDNKLTRYVAEFVCGAKVEDLPADVVSLGKKSILDGIGLALSGAVAKSGEYVRQHLADLNLGDGPATVI